MAKRDGLSFPYLGEELPHVLVTIADVSIDSWFFKTWHVPGNSHCLVHAANRKLDAPFRCCVQLGQVKGREQRCAAVKQPPEPVV